MIKYPGKERERERERDGHLIMTVIQRQIAKREKEAQVKTE